jgi:lysophospholipase L1-like esterase
LLQQVLARPGVAAGVPAAERRPRLSDEQFTAEIRRMADWCQARRATPVLLVWPFRAQMARPSLVSKQRALLDLAAARGLPVVDLVTLFQAHGGPGLFADVIHANATGHVVVADALEPLLKGNPGNGAN